MTENELMGNEKSNNKEMLLLNNNHNATTNCTKVLLIVYVVVLCWLLLFKLGVHFSYMEQRRVSLVPFYNVIKDNRAPDFAELILNVLVFIPAGIYVGMLFQKQPLIKKLLFFLLTSFFFESIQFLYKIGAFDTTDIVTNTTGGMIGLYIFYVTGKLFGDPFKAQKWLNVIAAAGTIVLITLLVLLKLNMLPVKYQ